MIVALVGAWLLVLVPIVARRRQEVARTADSTLAARVVRSGSVHSTAEREPTMADTGEVDTERETDGFESDFDEADFDERDELGDDTELDAELDGDFEEGDFEGDYDDYDDPGYHRYQREQSRPFRPGRGGFDAEAAAMTARARYTFRQRVVVLMLLGAVLAGLLAVTLSPLLWWMHAAIDIGLVGYLGYLRRQVRIEEEIRDRRMSRLGQQQRRVTTPAARPEHDAHGPAEDYEDEAPAPEPEPTLPQRRPLTRHVHPGTIVVDTDDDDPLFAELDGPGEMPYRRAVGE
jgi:hypothetical protein